MLSISERIKTNNIARYVEDAIATMKGHNDKDIYPGKECPQPVRNGAIEYDLKQAIKLIEELRRETSE